MEDGILIPGRRLMLRPLVETPLDKVKVVFLGREPIFGKWKNDGLAYSVMDPIKTITDAPMQFQEIVREATSDVNIKIPKVASLRAWAKQGVLLWNTIPTCRKGYTLSHINQGWEELTEEIIDTVYLQNPNAVFILHDSLPSIFRERLPKDALVINCGEPSRYGGGFPDKFRGSRIFSRTNALLRARRQQPVNWEIK